MSQNTRHQGGCHCGKVRYEVESDLASGITCNCSICQKTGTVLTFVPADKFKLISGEDDLTDYQFNKKIIHHLFCKTCGVRSFARGISPSGESMIAVNVRCIDDVDLAAVPTRSFDGRRL